MTYSYKGGIVPGLYLLAAGLSQLIPITLYLLLPGVNALTAASAAATGAVLLWLAALHLSRRAVLTGRSVWFVHGWPQRMRLDGVERIRLMQGEIGLTIEDRQGRAAVHALGKRPAEQDVDTFRRMLAHLAERAHEANPEAQPDARAQAFLSADSGYYAERMAGTAAERAALKGLGGWLAVIGAYLVITLVQNALTLAFGNPLPEAPADVNRFVRMTELVVAAVSLLLTAWALFCYFKKKKGFQRALLISFGVTAVSAVLLSFLLGSMEAGGLNVQVITAALASLVTQAVRFVALRGYALHSLRFRNTFIHE